MTILTDSKVAPQLFVWNGPIKPQDLEDWLGQRHLTLPSDLISFWRETGGGDLFESETILGPFGDREMADDIDSVDAFHHGKGLPSGFLLFHVGLYCSAVRLSDGKYVVLTHDYAPLAEYSSFEQWYMSLRSDFMESYGHLLR